ncbi:MAG: hypothetical protein IPM29_12185 [Planctomycetes bacterium]|nr:hypothetical protein [Planctomycetota bacterium]
MLGFAASRCPDDARIWLRSDFKSTYPALARQAFGERFAGHEQIDSKAPRTTANPLHRINLMLAILRDLMGRLRRRSWLVSKQRKRLAKHLQMLIGYRNYVRPRFNGEEESPAQLIGLVPRRLTGRELLRWRQDWGPERSGHPLSVDGESVAAFSGRWRSGDCEASATALSD